MCVRSTWNRAREFGAPKGGGVKLISDVLLLMLPVIFQVAAHTTSPKDVDDDARIRRRRQKEQRERGEQVRQRLKLLPTLSIDSIPPPEFGVERKDSSPLQSQKEMIV